MRESGAATPVSTSATWPAAPRRSTDDDASVSDAAKGAAASYAETFQHSPDILGKLVHD